MTGTTLHKTPVHICMPCPRHSVQFSCSVVSDSLRPHESQHTRPLCPSPTPGVHSKSCPSSRWCHPAISSSVVPVSSRLQSFPTSGSILTSWLFASDQSIVASASVLPMNIQDWFPLGWTGLISLQTKGLLRVFSNTTVQKHQFSFLCSPTLTSVHDHWETMTDGQGSLGCCSPWGCKESDTTEQLNWTEWKQNLLFLYLNFSTHSPECFP